MDTPERLFGHFGKEEDFFKQTVASPVFEILQKIGANLKGKNLLH